MIEIPPDVPSESAQRPSRTADRPQDGIPSPFAPSPDVANKARRPGAPEPTLEALLAFLERDPEKALRELSNLAGTTDPSTRLAREAVGLYLAAALGEHIEAHAAARQIERLLRPYCMIELRNACLTDGTDAGYGDPSRLEKSAARPGELLHLYYEVERLAQPPDGDRFRMHFDVDLRIETPEGRTVWEFEQWEKTFRLRDRRHVSRRYHTDVYFHYKGLAIPRQLSPGSYRLVVEFMDLAGPMRRTASASVPFEVVP